MRHIARISAFLLVASLAACGGKSLSKDQCEKLVDKTLDIGIKEEAGPSASPDMIEAAKKMAGNQIKELVEKCQKEGTQSEFDCGMKATNKKELLACDN